MHRPALPSSGKLVNGSSGPLSRPRLRWLAVLAGCMAATPALAAPYPFEGTWVQPEHVCAPGATRVRIYTAKDVTSPRGRCTIRRVANSGNAFELLEDCRHERNPAVTETIRMASPDSLTSRRQVSRLKIPRQIHYVRCTAAAPVAAPAPVRPAGRSFVPEPTRKLP